jgi:hypothetical protein
MFGKIAADALGLSDIGVIVKPADYNKVDADDYLFGEDGERIFFLIKSRKDEYCFTNFALIHVDGESAISSKRAIRRHEFATSPISDVTIETAGRVDMDVELKFTIGAVVFSIDVKKSYLEQLKDVYKSLISISREQHKDASSREHALRVLDATASMYKIDQADDVTGRYESILAAVNTAVHVTHTKRDFSDVFEKYIHN